jgi:hypothetical protein
MDTICECHRRKMIGKPYSGELNVRFDEGELEIEPSATSQLPPLPGTAGVSETCG